MTRGEGLRLAGALLAGLVLAFPLASLVMGGEETVPAAAPPEEGAEMRQMFSPDIRGDPYVRGRLRQQVELMEGHCERTGELCAEARGARERLTELEAR